MTWLEYEHDDLVSVPLILECEWNANHLEIDDDFLKLVLGRAKNRVMIFRQKSIEDINMKINDFQRRIKKFSKSQSGDRYLFAGLDWNNVIFKFRHSSALENKSI